MSENKILTRLKQLYALAVLRDGEEADEGRQNEARNAAFLLLKTARENGVQVKFIVPKAEPKPVPGPDSFSSFFWKQGPRQDPFASYAGGFDPDFKKYVDDMLRGQGVKFPNARSDPFKPPERSTKSKPKSKSASSGAPPLIYAKHPGRCVKCGSAFDVGHTVYWVRSVGCSHEACGYEELRRVAGE